MQAKPKEQTETRAELYGEQLPEMPPAERLVEIWLDLGCAQEGFSGAKPFSWQELSAYAQLTGMQIHRAEASCLVDMSRAYCQAVRDDNPLSIAPMERKHD